MSTEDWNTFLAGQLPPMAQLSASELDEALAAHGIYALSCEGDEHDDVNLDLVDLRDAETMMTLTFDGADGPGSLYDRAVSSCVTLNDLAGQHDGDEVPGYLVAASLADGWIWMIHPHLEGRVARWHVSVTMPHADADRVTARLNELKQGYAL